MSPLHRKQGLLAGFLCIKPDVFSFFFSWPLNPMQSWIALIFSAVYMLYLDTCSFPSFSSLWLVLSRDQFSLHLLFLAGCSFKSLEMVSVRDFLHYTYWEPGLILLVFSISDALPWNFKVWCIFKVLTAAFKFLLKTNRGPARWRSA